MQTDLVKNREHGAVGFTGARRSAQEHILRRQQGALVHATLNAVQRLHARERGLRPLRHLLDRTKLLVIVERLRLQRGNVHLLVPFLRASERTGRKLTSLVAHEVRTLRERQGIEFEHLTTGGGRAAITRAHLGHFTSQFTRLFPNFLLSRRLTIASRRVRRAHLRQDLRRLRNGFHLFLDVRRLDVARRSRQLGAPIHRESILQQNFDQIKLVVVEHPHERVLALAIVLCRQDLVNLLRELQTLSGVGIREPERLGDGALQPVRVDVGRVQAVLDVGSVLVVTHHTADRARVFDVFTVIIFVHIGGVQYLVDFGIFLLFLFELDGDADVVVQLLALSVDAFTGD